MTAVPRETSIVSSRMMTDLPEEASGAKPVLKSRCRLPIASVSSRMLVGPRALLRTISARDTRVEDPRLMAAYKVLFATKREDLFPIVI